MAIQEIRVAQKEDIGMEDPRAVAAKKQLEAKGLYVDDVRIADVNLFEGIDLEGAKRLADEQLTDIVHKSTVNERIFPPDYQTVIIGYPPEVVHPATDSLFDAAHFIKRQPTTVTQLREVAIKGNITNEQLHMAGRILKDHLEILFERIPQTLVIHNEPPPVQTFDISCFTDPELLSLARGRQFSLTLEELHTIKHYAREVLHRPITDVELEILDQTWSEHNVHKTFKGDIIDDDQEGREVSSLISRIMNTSTQFFEEVGVVSAFVDNAGGIRLGVTGQVVAMKQETHNHPSSIGPFGGSATGIGGVIRDIMGFGKVGHTIMGIETNLVGLPYTKPEDVLPGCLHPMEHLKGIVEGEASYGNQMGIPTPILNIEFHTDFAPKPIKMGGVLGIIEEQYVHKDEPKSGDLIVLIGGKTGRDGIHGASASSVKMTGETKELEAGSVQIGDAIMEKGTVDTLEECRDKHLIRTITDCGGGGLSSAVGEIIENIGGKVDLSLISLKYRGLAEWQIWLSEAQERMILIVDPKDIGDVREISKKCKTPMSVIGECTGDKMLTLEDGRGNIVAQLSTDFMHHGRAKKVMHMSYESYPEDNRVPSEPQMPEDWITRYKQVLGHLNICSKQPIHVRYDQSVQSMVRLAPYTGDTQSTRNDAIVLAPLTDALDGVVVTEAFHPMLNRIDPKQGAIWAVASALSKLAAAGGKRQHTALLDNFCWPSLDTPQQVANISRSVDGLCAAINATRTPFISGKDSVNMTYVDKTKGIRVDAPPVINVTAFSTIPDYRKTVSADIKSPNSILCVVGAMDTEHLGGSIYFEVHDIVNSHVPEVDLDVLRRTTDTLYEAIQTGDILSCKDIGQGGIAAALAQMCFGNEHGATIDLAGLNHSRNDFKYYAESAGTVIVEVESEERANELFNNVPYVILGKTTEEKQIVVNNSDTQLFTVPISELKESWQRPMEGVVALW